MRAFLVGIVLVASGISPSSGQRSSKTDPSPGAMTLSPDNVKWEKMPDGTGRETATLFGDRYKHDMFGLLVRWPPHTRAKAHSHPILRYVMVLSGTLYMGYGDRFDAARLEKRSPNTLVTEPSGVAHFAETREEGATLYFVGIGPDRTDPVEN